MKKYLLLILLPLLLIAMPSCRSKSNVAGGDSALTGQQEEAPWQNVSVPVKVELLEPVAFSISGRATMVRGEYVLVSMRMLGFEVGQVYVTPEELDIVVKQLDKMWIQQPIGERFHKLGLPFSTLQDALLGDEAAIERLPESLGAVASGSGKSPSLTLTTTAKGKRIRARLTVSLSEAQWDQPTPAKFSTPGSSYKKTTLTEAMKKVVI